MSRTKKCPMACFECSDLCLCSCHGEPAAEGVEMDPMLAWDSFFDKLHAKKPVTRRHVEALGLTEEHRERFSNFLTARKYYPTEEKQLVYMGGD
jgi:hypothetical protein